MAYRFSDTLKWQDEWFVDLSSIEKLLFLYLYDNCDLAGFLELSYRKIAFDLSCKDEQVKGAIKGLDKGIFLSDDGRCLLVKNFIKHQKNLPINPENKSHIGILKRVDLYINKFSNVTFDYKEGYLGIGALKPLKRGTGIGIVYSKISIEEREQKFKESLYLFTKYDKNPNGIYLPEIIREFFNYWKEPNKANTKMRFEMEKTWDLKLRLVRWGNNNFGKTTQSQSYSTSNKVSSN
jgi:hypothetical protein